MQMAAGNRKINGWNVTTITYTGSGIGLGGDFGDWLTTALPECTIAIGLLIYDFENGLPSTRGTAYHFIWDGNTKKAESVYNRVESSSLQVGVARKMSDNTYLCVVPTGATFTVLYQ